MANIYGVVAEHTAPHKGYRDVVQQLLDKGKGSIANAALWDDHFLNKKHCQYIAEPQTRYYENFVGQLSSDSLDFLRCRRLISLRAAVTKKPAVLSPSSLSCSMDSRSSRGSLTDIWSDLLFFLPVAITGSRWNGWCSVCTDYFAFQLLTWCSPGNILVVFTLIVSWCKNGNASECWNTAEASNHNVSWSNTMACSHDTQTRPKFVYLFLGIPEDFPSTTPTVLRVEADTEVDARSKLPHWTLTFAAQIRTESPCRLQLFSTDEGFMWIYEQRQAVSEVSHA